jgi:hypothetical protein
MTTRKQIRDIVAGILREQNPALSVFVGRTATVAESCLPLVTVTIDEGSVVQNISRGRHETAVLALSFMVEGNDDDVDAYADPAISAIIGSAVLASAVLKTAYLGYSYGREEQGTPFTGLSVLFEVTHIGE